MIIVAGLLKVEWNDFSIALRNPNIQYSIRLSMITCTITAVLSVIVSLPIGYLLSRFKVPGKILIDSILDIPIVLPPLVIGLSLLILFGLTVAGTDSDPFTVDDLFRIVSKKLFGRDAGIVFQIPAVVLAQFMVACAFAVRTMRATFDQISPRQEDVALTLGCNHSQAFWRVVLPQSFRGILTAGTLAWARALGEFGPISGLRGIGSYADRGPAGIRFFGTGNRERQRGAGYFVDYGGGGDRCISVGAFSRWENV